MSGTNKAMLGSHCKTLGSISAFSLSAICLVMLKPNALPRTINMLIMENKELIKMIDRYYKRARNKEQVRKLYRKSITQFLQYEIWCKTDIEKRHEVNSEIAIKYFNKFN